MNNKDLNQWIQKRLGIVPKDLKLYRMALTTRQYKVLEFLGDSVLDLVVSEHLVKKKQCPIDRTEGLDSLKQKIVENDNFARKVKEIDLRSVINISSTSHQEQITDNVIAEMLEALIGAVYLEQGLDKCREVINRLFDLDNIRLEERIQQSLVSEISILEGKNPISALQELLAKKGISPPDYSDGTAIGSSHSPLWIVKATCILGEKCLVSEGQGKRKGEAKAEAAKNLLPQVINYAKNLRIY